LAKGSEEKQARTSQTLLMPNGNLEVPWLQSIGGRSVDRANIAFVDDPSENLVDYVPLYQPPNLISLRGTAVE